jgi:hypothetical protein
MKQIWSVVYLLFGYWISNFYLLAYISFYYTYLILINDVNEVDIDSYTATVQSLFKNKIDLNKQNSGCNKSLLFTSEKN